MIACAFPPTGGPGVQRSAKFAKFLPEFGWLPTVWKGDRLHGLPHDPTLLSDVPESVCIVTHPWHDPFGNAPLSSRLAAAWRSRIKDRRLQRLLPDPYVVWARESLSPLIALAKRQEFDAVYSTFSPASNHWLALELVRRVRLPWVADFRDLWLDDYRYVEPDERRRVAHARLQQEILDAADVVIGVTPRQTALLARYVPDRPDKFVTITNGFDSQDFSEDRFPTTKPEDCCVLAHVGRFDRWRATDAWFAGLRRFVLDLGGQRDRFLLRLVGHVDDRTRGKLDACGVRFAVRDYVSHGEAIREMCSADALLLSVPVGLNAETVIPAKLFEYLAAERPILVVGPADGEAERIVQFCRAGFVAPDDAEDIAASLARLFNDWSCGNAMRGCDEACRTPFQRDVLTRTLGAVLDGLVSPTPRSLRLAQASPPLAAGAR